MNPFDATKSTTYCTDIIIMTNYMIIQLFPNCLHLLQTIPTEKCIYILMPVTVNLQQVHYYDMLEFEQHLMFAQCDIHTGFSLSTFHQIPDSRRHTFLINQLIKVDSLNIMLVEIVCSHDIYAFSFTYSFNQATCRAQECLIFYLFVIFFK